MKKIPLTKLFLMLIYFKRGHYQWLILPMWLFNIVIIWYQLFFNQFQIFGNIFIFGILFIVFYTPLAIFTGRWDFKKEKGNFQTEQLLLKEKSPIWHEVFSRFDRIEQQLEVLKK